ncbi:PEP/pyruvate-binding domain-containing protein [Amycolatopsis sp. DSM 110486]|uniref:PEP/pyruvate-binding domain-containing protein n=1 Tax=Amycolatopsis sp. DSM 110486 TaxID=2865832 RepID=UPI001C696300|nr:PEP/pyruvate-binding domain-containing protein [Amycolatopsis sp. DSM 110486]QYN23214.1 PEP/pyruvate-binding domain-containing protein [Amycolatopsis sp. DSM 110486]
MTAASTLHIGMGDNAVTTAQAGGKGRSLDTLCRLGVRVPEAFVVTTDAYRAAVTGSLGKELDRRIRALHPEADLTVLTDESAAIRELLFAETEQHGADADIRVAYAELAERTGDDEPPVAVRSSSAAEDSADRSFAGEHDSYLWVIGADEVSAAVRRCWASLFTARAISYRARDGVESTDDAMGVVVQRMVDATAAGVFMTLNPANGDRSKVVIESVWGLGEPLVSGTVTPDRFVIDKITREILTRDIAEKATRATRDPETGKGIATVPVDDADQSQPSLHKGHIEQLLEIAALIEKHAGTPQDGEFAIDGDHVHVVQARPETVWSTKPPKQVSQENRGALAHVLAALTGGTKP